MNNWQDFIEDARQAAARQSLHTGLMLNKQAGNEAAKEFLQDILQSEYDRSQQEDLMLAAKICDAAQLPFGNTSCAQAGALGVLVSKLKTVAGLLDDADNPAHALADGQSDKTRAFDKVINDYICQFNKTAAGVWAVAGLQPLQIAAACGVVIVEHYGFRPGTAEHVARLIDPQPVQSDRPEKMPGLRSGCQAARL